MVTRTLSLGPVGKQSATDRRREKIGVVGSSGGRLVLAGWLVGEVARVLSCRAATSAAAGALVPSLFFYYVRSCER
jgi:hypothetical protein